MDNMIVIRATHINGNVRMAIVRKAEDAPAITATLEARGYWKDITVEPFTAAKRRAA